MCDRADLTEAGSQPAEPAGDPGSAGEGDRWEDLGWVRRSWEAQR